MNIFRKTKAKKQNDVKIRELSQAERQEVSRGINPQPLPPCRSRLQ